MSLHLTLYRQKLCASLRKLPKTIWQRFKRYWKKNLWHKIIVILVVFISLCLGAMYGIARWYIATESGQPLTLGVSFIPDYAQSLGLNPESTMEALISDVHVKNFRLTSYWNDIETAPGKYNFTQLDWEFKLADQAHAKITLSVGLRQPRWPECHMPTWAEQEPASVWQPQLMSFITTVVNRYKDSPSLAAYQVENEYFLKGFGVCTNFNRSRLVQEYNLVKKLDPVHTLIVSRSNNGIGFPIGQPQPDEFGISIYKRVWDRNFSHRYFEYPIPAWYYAFLAGMQKIITGKNMIIDELQAEAWPPNGQTIQATTLAEQNKSMNAGVLKARIKYGEATGMKSIDLWGAEYWYYRLVILHDPGMWNVAKQAFQSANS